MVIKCRACRGHGCFLCNNTGREVLIWQNTPLEDMSLLERYWMLQEIDSGKEGNCLLVTARQACCYITQKELTKKPENKLMLGMVHLAEYLTNQKGRAAVAGVNNYLIAVAERFRIEAELLRNLMYTTLAEIE